MNIVQPMRASRAGGLPVDALRGDAVQSVASPAGSAPEGGPVRVPSLFWTPVAKGSRSHSNELGADEFELHRAFESKFGCVLLRRFCTHVASEIAV